MKINNRYTHLLSIFSVMTFKAKPFCAIFRFPFVKSVLPIKRFQLVNFKLVCYILYRFYHICISCDFLSLTFLLVLNFE